MTRAQATQGNQNPPGNLKQLSLEQLGNVEVTTASKEPEQVWRTAEAQATALVREAAGRPEVDAVYGMHNWPGLPPASSRSGPAR